MDILSELNNKDYIVDLNTNYEIKFCAIDEVDALIEFLRMFWKENHIFVLSRELFNWQHLDTNNNRYNFVIAKQKGSGEIHSVLGFVPTSQFDCNIEKIEIWPCIWKSRDDIKVKGLGVALYYFLKTQIEIETISILGISEVALSIYKHWNFTTGKINHYYILNDNIDDYKLIDNYFAVGKKKDIKNSDVKKLHKCSLDEYMQLDKAFFKAISKYKTKDYYINRFFKHPLYQYKAYIITECNIPIAVLFIRKCEANGRCAMRIVDYIGAQEALIGNLQNLQELLYNENAEYIDFINVGLNNDVLEASGFLNKKMSSIVIPNYFEPFYLGNVDLDYAYKTVNKDVELVFFKADADQDRPNML